MADPTDIYYIEDDQNIAYAVKEYLEQRNFRVTVCATLAQARQKLEERIPALVLLDWNMPDGRGDSLCRWIRGRWKELPVLFLTVRADSSDIVSGFRNGADDYVVKPFELEVLYARIAAIRIDQNRHAVFCHAKEIALSPSEYQLLFFLMKNKGRTVTRERILEQVWDVNGNYVNNNTLTVTMKRLRDKLSQPACLKTVRSVGYRMEDTL